MQEHRDSGGAGQVADGSAPDLDLVEYVVIAVPDLSSTVGVASAIRELVESAQIGILDMVGIVTRPDGRFTAVEPELLAGLAELRTVEGEVGGLLSEDDIALACRTLQAGHVGVDPRHRGPLGTGARGGRPGQRRAHHRR